VPFAFLGRLFRRAVTSEYSSLATSHSIFCDQKQSFSVYFLFFFVIIIFQSKVCLQETHEAAK
jgi:hypothetical protein